MLMRSAPGGSVVAARLECPSEKCDEAGLTPRGPVISHVGRAENKIVLSAETERLWSEYLCAERVRVRDVMMPALDRFIEALLRVEPGWRDWALRVAADVSDTGADIPVRFPLFQRVLLPALVDGVIKGLEGPARWLAHFESFLLNAKNLALPEGLDNAAALLKEALRVDPSDSRARKRLLDRMASRFEYALHELPAGVLYGYDGATIPECNDLLEELAEFRGHVEVLNEMAHYSALINECARHFLDYRDYLAASRPTGSYAGFLASRASIG
jgi:hypothetical protein